MGGARIEGGGVSGSERRSWGQGGALAMAKGVGASGFGVTVRDASWSDPSETGAILTCILPLLWWDVRGLEGGEGRGPPEKSSLELHRYWAASQDDCEGDQKHKTLLPAAWDPENRLIMLKSSSTIQAPLLIQQARTYLDVLGARPYPIPKSPEYCLGPQSPQGSQGDDKKPVNTSLKKITPILETAVKTTGHKWDGTESGVHRKRIKGRYRETREIHTTFGLTFIWGAQPGMRALHVVDAKQMLAEARGFPSSTDCLHVYTAVPASIFSPCHTLIPIISVLGHQSHFIGGGNQGKQCPKTP